MRSAVREASPEAEGPGKGPAWDPAAGETRTCVCELRWQVPAPPLVCPPLGCTGTFLAPISSALAQRIGLRSPFDKTHRP